MGTAGVAWSCWVGCIARLLIALLQKACSRGFSLRQRADATGNVLSWLQFGPRDDCAALRSVVSLLWVFRNRAAHRREVARRCCFRDVGPADVLSSVLSTFVTFGVV